MTDAFPISYSVSRGIPLSPEEHRSLEWEKNPLFDFNWNDKEALEKLKGLIELHLENAILNLEALKLAFFDEKIKKEIQACIDEYKKAIEVFNSYCLKISQQNVWFDFEHEFRGLNSFVLAEEHTIALFNDLEKQSHFSDSVSDGSVADDTRQSRPRCTLSKTAFQNISSQFRVESCHDKKRAASAAVCVLGYIGTIALFALAGLSLVASFGTATLFVILSCSIALFAITHGFNDSVLNKIPQKRIHFNKKGVPINYPPCYGGAASFSRLGYSQSSVTHQKKDFVNPCEGADDNSSKTWSI